MPLSNRREHIAKKAHHNDLLISAQACQSYQSLPSPLLLALNGVFIGVFFANCGTISKRLLGGLIVFMLAIAVISTLSVPGVCVPYIIGIIATSLALLPRWTFHPRVKMNWLSDCTLGIYLSHPFWFLVISKFKFSLGLSLPFLVFAISAISVWLLKRVTPSIAKYAV